MRQIIGLFLLSLALMFVCCKKKPNNPPPRNDAGYYYPRRENYGWRYVELARACTAIHDSFDVKIVDRSVRDGKTGFDRLRYYNGEVDGGIVFIYEQADTLFEMTNVELGIPLLKILVGPVKQGTAWRDNYFNYEVSGFEDITLVINGVTYKNCVKIMKKSRNPSHVNTVYEWWLPSYGKVKEIEEDPNGTCVRGTELRYFDPQGIFP